MTFSFFVLLFLIKRFSFRFVNSNIYNIYINYEYTNPNYLLKIYSCIKIYTNESDMSLTKCFINETRNDIESFIGLLKNSSMYPTLKNITKNEAIKAILSVLEDSVKNNGTLVDYLHEALKYKDNSSLTLFDYLENILNNLNTQPFNYDNIIGNISKILVMERVIDIIYYFIEHNESLFFGIIQTFSENFNRTELINAIAKIVKNKKDIIQTLLKNEKFKTILKKLLRKQNNLLSILISIFLDKKEILKIFFDLPNFSELVENIKMMFININNIKYIRATLMPFLYSILFSSNIGRDVREVFLNDFQNLLRNFFVNKGINAYNLSLDCKNLFINAFFENKETKEYTLKYLKKFIFDSPMNKGDFMAFDNCLDDSEKNFSINYDVEPAFIIGIFDYDNKSEYTNSTFYEKYHYISNFCFPYGKRKNDSTEACTEDDYIKILRFFKDLFISNSKGTTIKTIVVTKNTNKLESRDYLIGIFSLVILAIPILIKIGLIISKYIIEKKHNKDHKINKLINDKKPSKISINYENELKSTKKSNLSKCHILLNNCFDFYKNGAELFNFNLNNTNFNNINGITYIKGLLGLSIILNVFGLTFTNLMNVHMKDYGIWHFFRTNQSLLFLILSVGYRYSSRVLFSCSGYTLVYKYLNFIEQDKGLYFLKFIILQSYKYLILYLILIIFRFSVVRIIFLFRGRHRPAWTLFEYYLDKEDFLPNAFAFLFKFNTFDIQEKRQNLIYNFYMPINEIFFFIVGTILISIGYKYKLRIDIFIIIIILLIFLVRIILYSITSLTKYFLTTDYYTFDMGLFSLTPLYNISYFFIGMYFGLINYSIQKGITNMYKENQYKKYYQLEETNKKNNENEENSLMSPINIDDEDTKNNQENEETQKVNKLKDEDLNKYLSTKENNMVIDNINKPENELIEQIKDMPFLKSPIQFYNVNKKYKEHIFYKILIFLALFVMILLCYSRIIFIQATSGLGDIKGDMDRKDYRTRISLEKIIPNKFLNILNVLDSDIIVFLSNWIIFLLFFKEVTLIREFCNSIYWSFFVKSYYSYLLISVPIILCIIHESESVIKLHMYNFILFSLINVLYIFVFVIVFYSVFELPIKKLFKYILKRNEIIEEEEEEEDENDEEAEKEEEKEQNIILDDDEEEIRSLKD